MSMVRPPIKSYPGHQTAKELAVDRRMRLVEPKLGLEAVARVDGRLERRALDDVLADALRDSLKEPSEGVRTRRH